jgi:hypothetical protein
VLVLAIPPHRRLRGLLHSRRSDRSRNWGEWNVVASYIEAKGPPEIVNQIGWRGDKDGCLGADAAAALGKWMQQALVVDDPTLFLRLELSEHDLATPYRTSSFSPTSSRAPAASASNDASR